MLDAQPVLNVPLPESAWIALTRDPVVDIRMKAFRLAAPKLSREALIDVMGRMAESPEKAERLTVARSLRYVRFNGDTVASFLQSLANDDDAEVSGEALVTLVRLSDAESGVAEAMARLQQGTLTQQQALDFLRVLRYRPEAAVGHLPVLTALPNGKQREIGVSIYLDHAREAALEPDLTALIADPHDGVREAVLQALYEQPGWVDEALAEQMYRSPHTGVRKALLRLLRRFEPQRASVLAMDLLLDDNARVRADALEFLVRVRAEGWETFLEAAMDDDDPVVQRMVIRLIMSRSVANPQKWLERFLERQPDSPIAPLVRRQLER